MLAVAAENKQLQRDYLLQTRENPDCDTKTSAKLLESAGLEAACRFSAKPGIGASSEQQTKLTVEECSLTKQSSSRERDKHQSAFQSSGHSDEPDFVVSSESHSKWFTSFGGDRVFQSTCQQKLRLDPSSAQKQMHCALHMLRFTKGALENRLNMAKRPRQTQKTQPHQNS